MREFVFQTSFSKLIKYGLGLGKRNRMPATEVNLAATLNKVKRNR